MKRLFELGRSVVLGAAMYAFLGGAVAQAESYPNKPVKIIAPYAAGGASDTMARYLAQKLTETLGQSFVVENRPGGAGSIAYAAAASSPADGYTLVYATASMAVNEVIKASVPYKSTRDFIPIVSLLEIQNVLIVPPSLPVKNLGDLISLAKQKPGSLNFVSLGTGSTPHLVMELFRSAANIDIVHVPYKLTPQGYTDMTQGRVQLWFASMPSALPFINSGKLKALAVAGKARSPVLPDVPTVRETGLEFQAAFWHGLFAPAGTPPAVVKTLNTAINKILAEKDVQAWFAKLGAELNGGPPERLASELQNDLVLWTKVAKDLNLKIK